MMDETWTIGDGRYNMEDRNLNWLLLESLTVDFDITFKQGFRSLQVILSYFELVRSKTKNHWINIKIIWL